MNMKRLNNGYRNTDFRFRERMCPDFCFSSTAHFFLNNLLACTWHFCPIYCHLSNIHFPSLGSFFISMQYSKFSADSSKMFTSSPLNNKEKEHFSSPQLPPFMHNLLDLLLALKFYPCAKVFTLESALICSSNGAESLFLWAQETQVSQGNVTALTGAKVDVKRRVTRF